MFGCFLKRFAGLGLILCSSAVSAHCYLVGVDEGVYCSVSRLQQHPDLYKGLCACIKSVPDIYVPSKDDRWCVLPTNPDADLKHFSPGTQLACLRVVYDTKIDSQPIENQLAVKLVGKDMMCPARGCS